MVLENVLRCAMCCVDAEGVALFAECLLCVIFVFRACGRPSSMGAEEVLSSQPFVHTSVIFDAFIGSLLLRVEDVMFITPCSMRTL